MFIGHFALGFAAKRAAPGIPLAILFAAVEFADLLWPILLLVGLEQVRIEPGNTRFTPLDFVSYPYSHSLALLAVWGLAFGVLYARTAVAGMRTVVVLALLVISHWLLDVLTHRPDMPVYPGGPRVGLGLWNSLPATVLVEGAMYAAGVWIYATSTRARDSVGRWAFWSFTIALVIFYLANAFGPPPPPSVPVLATSAAVGGVVLIAWSWWGDRHREVSASKSLIR